MGDGRLIAEPILDEALCWRCQRFAPEVRVIVTALDGAVIDYAPLCSSCLRDLTWFPTTPPDPGGEK
jgi:hypothetical protein